MVSGTRINKRVEDDLSGLMDHSMTARTKTASAKVKVLSNGPTAVTIMENGATTKCMVLASLGGQMDACTQAITKTIRSMGKVCIRGPTGAGTKAYFTKAASTEKASTGKQMEKKSMAYGT